MEWKYEPITDGPYGPMGGNYTIQNDELFISYQDYSAPELKENAFAHTAECPETGMKDRVTGLWMVLNGDWRKEYEAVWPDKEKCIALYMKLKTEHGNPWSSA